MWQKGSAPLESQTARLTRSLEDLVFPPNTHVHTLTLTHMYACMCTCTPVMSGVHITPTCIPHNPQGLLFCCLQSGRFSLCSLLGVQDSRLCSMSFMKVLSQARKWPSGQTDYHPGMRAQFLIPNTCINEMRHGNLPVTLLLGGQSGNKVTS